ncbi:MAG: peptide chain release factor 2 [Candidatus Brocadiia bacterium]
MILDLSDLKGKLEAVSNGLEELERALDLPGKKERIRVIEGYMAQQGFWDNQDAARPLVRELAGLKKTIEQVGGLRGRVTESFGMVDLVVEDGDPSLVDELIRDFDSLQADFRHFELLTLMSGENDSRNVIMSIHAGAGGTESCDWVSMLLRMYTRWLERSDFKFEQTHIVAGEEAGIKSVTLEIEGFYAYGHLRSECGVHRLVRISPFDSNARRHTSFSSVDILPVFDDVEVNIEDKELKVDTYKAGGPGGQHVNKTESAVRITHLPTGIVVQCQAERSQIKNRQVAMRELVARIQRYYEAQRDAELKVIIGERGEIAWGNQIRSYVLQPYTLVKDHRTDVEETDVRKVLDGEIDGFIESYLRHRLTRDLAGKK